MNYVYDDSDDILDDIDFDDDALGGIADMDDVGLDALLHSSSDAFRNDDPAALAQRMIAAGRNPLVEATRDHEPDLIQAAHSAGETYPKDADVVMLVAQGIRIDDLDAWHHQSVEGISRTLEAVRETGADLNREVGGVPAAHRLAAYYGEKIVGNFYDDSYAAQVGVIDRGQAERLAVFAEKGVDFSVQDTDGRSPFKVVSEIAQREAAARGQDEAPVLAYLKQEMAPVRQAAREQRVSQVAAQRAAGNMSTLPEPKRPARQGPSLDD